jgi:hypothetical protein
MYQSKCLCSIIPLHLCKTLENWDPQMTKGSYQSQDSTKGDPMYRPSYRPAGEQGLHYPVHISISQPHHPPYQEPLVDKVRDVLTHTNKPSSITKMCHNWQRRFEGKPQKPHIVSWVAQHIHEDEEERSIRILLAWTHPRRYREVDPEAIQQLNGLPDTNIIEALNELKQQKKYIQGIGGNKLSTRIIVKAINKQIETITLIDSGCTGLCIHSWFVKQNKIPTRKLPRPIPVYNANGTLNKHDAITETMTLELTI